MRRHSPRDAALAPGIERLVRKRTRGGVRRLKIAVGGTGVVPHGDAATRYLKRLATRAAFAPTERPRLVRPALRNEVAVGPIRSGTAGDEAGVVADFSGGGR